MSKKLKKTKVFVMRVSGSDF